MRYEDALNDLKKAGKTPENLTIPQQDRAPMEALMESADNKLREQDRPRVYMRVIMDRPSRLYEYYEEGGIVPAKNIIFDEFWSTEVAKAKARVARR